MALNTYSKDKIIAPWARVAIMLTSLAVMFMLSWILTGSLIPEESPDALIFQNALLLIVLGSAILEYKFTKPADSVVNALTGIITLITIYHVAPKSTWWLIFLYCLIVFVMASACSIVSTGKHITGWRKSIAKFTYTPSIYFGKDS